MPRDGVTLTPDADYTFGEDADGTDDVTHGIRINGMSCRVEPDRS
jgi:hypothetical protein